MFSGRSAQCQTWSATKEGGKPFFSIVVTVNAKCTSSERLTPEITGCAAVRLIDVLGRYEKEPKMIAALYVETDGAYFGLPGVEPWDEPQDARRYSGPLPVVAHPPCQLWGAMANVNYARWGGEHNRPGNDGGCFAAALDSVRRFGGVLEHPAKTKAWAAHGLAPPAGIGWQRTIDGGWVCEVWQSAYGHRANKATWLYYSGTTPPFELRWNRPEGTHQIGFYDQRGKAANKPTLSKREANATPLEFRDELLLLAMMAHNA